MKKDFATGSSSPLQRLIFSDLDGTLLDPETYGWEEAQEALDLCGRRCVPVILASSKTRAEMEILRGRMSLTGPFIVENGGGIFLPTRTFKDQPPGACLEKDLWKWPQGPAYESLTHALGEIRQELGYPIRGFSEMTIREISGLTGLGEEMARKAAQREFDEPFIIRAPGIPDLGALHSAAVRRGLSITEGGRFFHLQGPIDKGMAMDRVVFLYRGLFGKVLSVALGDSPNDFSMLERADYPVLIRSRVDFPEFVNRVPSLTVTREKGPRGWNEAVLNILDQAEE
ncbi:MAG: HAD-IIB family hydrolase [Desulfatiglandaceae bacterium]|jgi:mannosyl-3-phosphoglycerate phosphatase